MFQAEVEAQTMPPHFEAYELLMAASELQNIVRQNKKPLRDPGSGLPFSCQPEGHHVRPLNVLRLTADFSRFFNVRNWSGERCQARIVSRKHDDIFGSSVASSKSLAV
jgi:hypothetical protein